MSPPSMLSCTLAALVGVDLFGRAAHPLLDSTALCRRVTDLDPATEGFADQATAAITDALEATLRLGGAAAAAAPPAP